MRIGRVVVLGIVLQPQLFGCLYDLPRTEGLGDGEIHGRAVRADGTPVASARVLVHGAARAAEVRDDGTFAVRGLSAGPWVLSIAADEDGDGTPELAARVSAVLVEAAIPKNATDGCTGAPPAAPTSVLLGEVVLQPTRTLSGTVRINDGSGPRALAGAERALVVRTEGASFLDDPDAGVFSGPVESAAGVAADGSFTLRGLRDDSDNLELSALVFDAAAGPHAPSWYGTLRVGAGVGAGADAVALIADRAAPISTGVEIALRGAFSSVEIGTVSFERPGGGDVAPPDDTLLRADNGGFVAPVIVDAPVGLYDLSLFPTQDGSDVSEGVQRGALVLPLSAWSAIQGPIELPREDPCLDATGARDCDHDGRPTLPSPDDPDALPDWVACAAQCADTWGADGKGASCAIASVQIDCDDDGDGQPDVTEPAHCLGPGRGTDLDGDGLCEPTQDPFPLCASNDPAACPQPFARPPARY